ncbi:hypothetical protein [Candidatus Nitrosocosmicus arcticus]|uniref:Uncharacterized protein n=1 Tax=Candidatus Nitrosocosmicus arcticus TaxID=2035267 RepID=A0A557SRU5_9ARCH|nr:hypothetical protein [Candidatus Nitrosocosmicus arcticus]TVP39324.1 hypothetical protein NARC_160037 [Candidatus Nitrosocosmicus arcticus]
MKALSNIEFFGLSFVLITILALEISLHSDAFSQENKKKYDMVLLSQNYNSKGFADEIVGEILNNGTDIAKSVEISVVFSNDSGIIGSESSRLDPTTMNSGDRSVFTLQLVDEVIKSNAERYEFTIKWQDEHSIDYFARLTGGEIAENSGGDDSGGDDSGGDDSGGDDSGGDDSGGGGN